MPRNTGVLSSEYPLNVNFDYLKSNYTPDFGIGSVEGKINDRVGRGTFLNVNGAFNKTNSTNGQAALDHNFNDNWKLTAIASVQAYDRNYYGSERLQANAQGMAPRALSRTMSEEFTRNQQINITGKFSTGDVQHQILIGSDADQSAVKAYAFNIYADLTNPSKVSTAYDVVNVFEPYATNRRLDVPDFGKNTWTKTNIYRYGVFVQDLVALSDKFKVLAGIRYTNQRTPYSNKYTYSTNTSVEEIIRDKRGNELGSKNDRAWSPKVGLIYQPIPTTTVYASYTNNFTPNTGYDINYKPLSPSIIDHFEAGVKNDFFQGRLSTNFTAYRINNNKFAQQALLDAKGANNADPNLREFTGKTSSDGVELDVTGHILPGLNVLAGYAYNFMRYTETTPIFRGRGIDVATGNEVAIAVSGSEEGVRLVGTTAHTGNATVFYTIQNGAAEGLKVGVSAFYTGKRNAGWNNSKINVEEGVNRLIPVDPFTTFDLSLGYTIGKLTLLAKVANVTDEFSYYIHENYSVNPIPPRNLMTTLSYKF